MYPITVLSPAEDKTIYLTKIGPKNNRHFVLKIKRDTYLVCSEALEKIEPKTPEETFSEFNIPCPPKKPGDICFAVYLRDERKFLALASGDVFQNLKLAVTTGKRGYVAETLIQEEKEEQRQKTRRTLYIIVGGVGTVILLGMFGGQSNRSAGAKKRETAQTEGSIGPSQQVESTFSAPEDPEIARRRAITEGIAESEKVVADKGLCDTPKAIADAWTKLKQVTPSDPEIKQAKDLAKKLEKCRATTEKKLDKEILELMVAQRESMASRMETSFLDDGLDVRVTLSGKNKNEIKMTWVLMSRPTVHQITKDGTFLAGLEKTGFKRVTFSDGFGESFWYDLEPQDETGAGKKALKDLGLDVPISL